MGAVENGLERAMAGGGVEQLSTSESSKTSAGALPITRSSSAPTAAALPRPGGTAQAEEEMQSEICVAVRRADPLTGVAELGHHSGDRAAAERRSQQPKREHFLGAITDLFLRFILLVCVAQ